MKCVVPGTNPTRSRCYYPSGSTEPKYISPGYYGSGGDSTNLTHSGQTICPKGYYYGWCRKLPWQHSMRWKFALLSRRYVRFIDWVANKCLFRVRIAGWYCKPGSTISQQISVDMDCQFLFIVPLDLTRLKQMWVTVIPIAQLHRQGIHCSNMTRELRLIVKKAMPARMAISLMFTGVEKSKVQVLALRHKFKILGLL